MLGTPLFLLIATSAAALACLLSFIPRQKLGRSPGYYFALVVGVWFLLSLPAGLWQGLAGIEKIRNKPAVLRLAIPFIAAPYNMGGWTVRQAFETVTDPLAQDPGGQPRPVAVLRYPVYMVFLFVQVAAVGAAAVFRIRRTRRFGDPVLAALAAAVLFNSLVNAQWEWWAL